MSSEIRTQLEILRRGFDSERYPSVAVRRSRIKRLRQLLLDNENRLLTALSEDYGYRSPKQSAFADITTTIKSANHALKHLNFWMQSERRSTDLSLRLSGASSYVEYMPKGVVGILSPWNFPINLALSPMVSVLAAGNRAFLKPSEGTPATSELLQQLIADYFSPDEVTVVCGGAEIAQAFCELPFDHLIYTGGTQIAKSIMASAAQHLVPLTLELGGKSPVVIDDSANLKTAAQRVAFGKYFNAGQICIAPDYVLLPRAQVSEFTALLKQAFEARNSSAIADDHVEIINDRHASRLHHYLSTARENGAEVHEFTAEHNNASLSVVISNGNAGEIEDHEIFGPSLLVYPVDSFEECLAHINRRSPPLVTYYFGRNEKHFTLLRHATQSGALVKNDVIFQYANDDLPFGGQGESGMGRYRGEHGFKEFSNQRAIFKSGWLDVSGMVTPPYPQFFGLVNKVMRKL